MAFYKAFICQLTYQCLALFMFIGGEGIGHKTNDSYENNAKTQSAVIYGHPENCKHYAPHTVCCAQQYMYAARRSRAKKCINCVPWFCHKWNLIKLQQLFLKFPNINRLLSALNSLRTECIQTSLKRRVHEACVAKIAQTAQPGTRVVSYVDADVWVRHAITQTAARARTDRRYIIPIGQIVSKYSAISQNSRFSSPKMLKIPRWRHSSVPLADANLR